MVNFESLFEGVYKDKKVLLTGHTGFKGPWLALWLEQMGAKVYGFSLKNEDDINHLSLLNLGIEEKINDIRNADVLEKYFQEVQPDIVFHLAAQALVRKSYDDPVETFSTNVMGTLNIFEACRKTPSVKAIVNVTTDKCYENKEWEWGYRENEPMGGYDPYSASKGCSELLTSSYRNSYFNPKDFGNKHEVLLASGRAGNVIGGGDWAVDRLIPDIIKATAKNEAVLIRNPLATRPWQHVLEPLSGYLTLGWKLLKKDVSAAEGWNFGPDNNSNLQVGDIVKLSHEYWSNIQIEISKNTDEHHEANLLMLDCSKANKKLKWKAVWGIDKTIDKTITWYREYYENNKILSHTDLEEYISDAKAANILWAL
ncbi:CDP-glucose 4,6-dehydratase [Polaribacter vadi]|uniref:CDP-glucose 4,6-dehydratase n=1 Tax=Polaribacter vadi TaxID=1774273 RepID=UPI0030EDAB6E|tara:strand:- start:687 stop:1793 length:1107 start_codon:yes stop_codon:yes gene_type:complete